MKHWICWYWNKWEANPDILAHRPKIGRVPKISVFWPYIKQFWKYQKYLFGAMETPHIPRSTNQKKILLLPLTFMIFEMLDINVVNGF